MPRRRAIDVDVQRTLDRANGFLSSRYIELYRSGSWRERFETWPLIIVVTPTERRAALLLSATRKLVATQQVARQVEFAFCALPKILAESPLAAVWRVSTKDEPQRLVGGSP